MTSPDDHNRTPEQSFQHNSVFRAAARRTYARLVTERWQGVTRALVAIVLATLLVAAPLTGLVAVEPTAAQESGPPSGMVGLSDGQIDDLRAGDEHNLTATDLDVYTDAHDDTLNVSLVTESQADEVANGTSLPDVANEKVCSNSGNAGEKNPNADCDRDTSPSLVLSDDTHSAGRTVAIRAGPVEDALGYTPSFITIRNSETGDRWDAPARTDDGWLIVDVPHFSDNAVTWTGEVSISGTAQDESSFQYNISDYDSSSEPQLDVTGILNEKWDNETASAVAPTSTHNIQLSGTSIEGPGGGDPLLTVEALGENATYTPSQSGTGDTHVGKIGGSDGYGSYVDNQFKIVPNESGMLTEITAHVADGSSGGYGVTKARVSKGSIDDTYNEGTTIGKYVFDNELGDKSTITYSGQDSMFVEKDEVYTVAITSDPYNDDPQEGWTYITSDQERDGTWSKSNSESADDTSLVSNGGSGDAADIDLDIEAQPASVNVTSEGSTVSFGDIPAGESQSERLPITTDATELDFQGSGTHIDYDLAVNEQTKPQDIDFALNGDQKNIASELDDGQTETYSFDTSDLQSDTNTLDVSLGDGTLSADAPEMKVDFAYNHTASTQQTVDYTAEQFTERYNVSKTFASDRESTSLTIPFQSSVVRLRDIQVRDDGGSWSSLSSSEYTLDNTTLTAQLGAVSAGDETAVRVNGSLVQPDNASISVLDPSLPGEQLDTQLAVDDWNADSYIDVGPAEFGSRAHYAYDASYGETDDYARITASGANNFHLPNANDNATVRISTIPVDVKPETGDVIVEVTDSNVDEPEYDVRPGESEGDTVEYTHINAEDDREYTLYSLTREIVLDSGVASSPLTLVGDDSEQTLAFWLADSDSSSDDGGDEGGSTGPIGQVDQEPSSSSIPVPIIYLGAGLLSLVILYVAYRLLRRRFGGGSGKSRSQRSRTSSGGGGGSGGRARGLVGGISAAVRRLFRLIGRTAGRAMRVLRRVVRDGPRWASNHPRLAMALALLGSLMLLATGVVPTPDVPSEVMIMVTVVAVPGIAYIVMRATDNYSAPVWFLLTAVSAIAGLEVISGDLVNSITESPAFVLMALGGLWLLRKVVNAWQAPNEEVNIQLETSEDGD